MTEKMRLNKKRYLELINSITIKDADLKDLTIG